MSFRERGGYGEYNVNSMGIGGLGKYTDFGGTGDMDDDVIPLETTQRVGGGLGGGLGRRAAGGGSLLSGGGGYGGGVQQDVMYLKQDNNQMKSAIIELEKDRDNLRQAIRKLKVENSRMKIRMKRLGEAINKSQGDSMDTGGADLVDVADYDDIGEYILIGGQQDPLSLRYEAPIRDLQGLEHKSAERYYWYKMAETFGDMDTAEKIRTAANTIKAEEEMKTVKNFDEATWNQSKLRFWEDGQRMKIDQVRWIQNLLVYTDKTYLAVASQDKTFGTGWRKTRQEAWQPKYWDGENGGGKALMRLRTTFHTSHAWMGPYEEQETEKKYNELKRSAWRRDRDRERGGFNGTRRGGMGMGMGMSGQMGRRGLGMGMGGGPAKRGRRF